MLSKVSRSGLLLSAASLVAALAVIAAPMGSAQAQVQFGYIQDFEAPERPHKKKMNELFRPILNDYREEIHRRQEQGDNVTCSVQIFREAHWLVNYTTFKDRVEARVADLKKSLEEKDQAWAGEQVESDGSWGACYKAWFMRLDASVDPLKELAVKGERPRYPLKVLDPVSTPEQLTEVFEGLLVSRMETDGISRRKEMNKMVTAMGQLLLLPYTRSILDPGYPADALAQALIRFMDETWQNPETGYWGEWYEDEKGEIVKTDDLSITFHIVSYRNGKVPRLRQIVDTTFNLREGKYPFGWLDRGTRNNHHMYDVAALLRFGWPQMTDIQRARARAEIYIMLARSLRLTMDGQGRFYPDAYDNIGDAYYFGVSLLDEIGYFSDSQFWSNNRRFPEAEEVRRLIAKNLEALDRSDPMVAAAIRKLENRD